MAVLDEASAANAVAQWVGIVCAIPSGRRFAYPQAAKTAELPDVAASVASSRVQQGSDEIDFPLAAVENVWLSVFVVEFSIMVEQGTDEAGAAAAQAAIYGYASAIRADRLADATLRAQLAAIDGQFASPLVAFNFATPFVEYEDGTRGRVMPGEIALAQAIAAPE